MQKLIKKNKSLLVKYTTLHDEYHIKLHTLIASILKDKQGFLSMDVDKAFAVLYDLGYDTKGARVEYARLLSENID